MKAISQNQNTKIKLEVITNNKVGSEALQYKNKNSQYRAGMPKYQSTCGTLPCKEQCLKH